MTAAIGTRDFDFTRRPLPVEDPALDAHDRLHGAGVGHAQEEGRGVERATYIEDVLLCAPTVPGGHISRGLSRDAILKQRSHGTLRPSIDGQCRSLGD